MKVSVCQQVPSSSLWAITSNGINLHKSIYLWIYTIKDPSPMLNPAILHSATYIDKWSCHKKLHPFVATLVFIINDQVFLRQKGKSKEFNNSSLTKPKLI